MNLPTKQLADEASGMPTVTIGLPVYNGARYLDAALQSLTKQTFTDFEIVISDNASTDATETICRNHARHDSRVRYYRHQENRGAAWNHNFLIREARGRYFRWHSHDDVCAPEHLELCVAALEAQSDTVLAYPVTTIIDASGETVGIYDDRLELSEAAPHDRLRHFFREVHLCNPVLSLIRVSALRNTGLLGAYISADHVLLVELALQGKFAEVPHQVFYRRVHPGKSTVANRTLRDRAAWFDPAHSNARLFFPKARLFWEFLRSVATSDLKLSDKLRCTHVIADHYLRRLAAKMCSLVLRRPRARPSRIRPVQL